jgi:outer membrane protein
MTQKRKIYTLVFAFWISIALLSCKRNQKVGYIEVQKVFAEFQYKKELEKELESIRTNRQNVLDSMKVELESLARQAEENQKDKQLLERFLTKKQVYFKKQTAVEEEERGIVRGFDEKIFKQLNAFVKQFGKENGYSMIHGANASGNIMYADSTTDVTEAIIKFINDKYKGK